MAPPPVGTIASIANLQVRNMPRPSMAITCSQSAGSPPSHRRAGLCPRWRPTRRAARIDRPLPRSSAARPPRLKRRRRPSRPQPLRALIHRPAPTADRPEYRSRSGARPRAAKSSAVARPMPNAAPVITADLPWRRPSLGHGRRWASVNSNATVESARQRASRRDGSAGPTPGTADGPGRARSRRR